MQYDYYITIVRTEMHNSLSQQQQKKIIVTCSNSCTVMLESAAVFKMFAVGLDAC